MMMKLLMSKHAVLAMLVSLLEMAAAQSPCSIPTVERYDAAKFGLVYYAQRRLVPASAFTVEGGHRYLNPGIEVPDSVWLRVYCTRDTYGDAIHEAHASLCRDGTWAHGLPDCKEHVRCGMIPYLFSAYSSERRRPGMTYAHGHVVTFRCRHRGQRLAGNKEIFCNDGKWSPLQFTCV